MCLFTWLSAYCWPPHWDVDVSSVGVFTCVLELPVCVFLPGCLRIAGHLTGM